jgi:prepilin-type N-terminal cleavage/methylation domain-containing protein
MRRRRCRGFSIIEVLAAMSLFAILASAICAIATASVRFTTSNRHATLAAMLAQRELEDLRGMAYDAIVSRSTADTVEGQAFTIASGVTVNSPAAGMKRIVVTVSWTGPEGSRDHEIETIFTSLI